MDSTNYLPTFSGSQRFCTLESSLPVSGRLLSERLKELELEGIVERKSLS